MVKMNKLKHDRVSKFDAHRFHTYSMLDVYVTNKELYSKGDIIISTTALNKLIELKKAFSGKMSYRFGSRTITITNKDRVSNDVIELSGIKNKTAIFTLESDEIDFILEVYKQIRKRKLNNIKLLNLSRLTLKIDTKVENVYIFLRSKIK